MAKQSIKKKNKSNSSQKEKAPPPPSLKDLQDVDLKKFMGCGG